METPQFKNSFVENYFFIRGKLESSVRVLAPKIESGGCCRSSMWVREQFRFWGTQLVLGFFFLPLSSPLIRSCVTFLSPVGMGGRGDSSNTDGEGGHGRGRIDSGIRPFFKKIYLQIRTTYSKKGCFQKEIFCLNDICGIFCSRISRTCTE